ncbi:hypothetical protein H6P81_010588 [Aristolochia fimbriata]|uniref:Uncharacterized protein n=1 Tax=Aristolochia fimbriata TaxID=158543 RepID=A0AAV7EP71_ARIFI|nr:hypothetical protein H6P81_010588 [Aristolochia fimbriata]
MRSLQRMRRASLPTNTNRTMRYLALQVRLVREELDELSEIEQNLRSSYSRHSALQNELQVQVDKYQSWRNGIKLDLFQMQSRKEELQTEIDNTLERIQRKVAEVQEQVHELEQLVDGHTLPLEST